jgi:hypothetical protein
MRQVSSNFRRSSGHAPLMSSFPSGGSLIILLVLCRHQLRVCAQHCHKHTHMLGHDHALNFAICACKLFELYDAPCKRTFRVFIFEGVSVKTRPSRCRSAGPRSDSERRIVVWSGLQGRRRGRRSQRRKLAQEPLRRVGGAVTPPRYPIQLELWRR